MSSRHLRDGCPLARASALKQPSENGRMQRQWLRGHVEPAPPDGRSQSASVPRSCATRLDAPFRPFPGSHGRTRPSCAQSIATTSPADSRFQFKITLTVDTSCRTDGLPKTMACCHRPQQLPNKNSSRFRIISLARSGRFIVSKRVARFRYASSRPGSNSIARSKRLMASLVLPRAA